MQCNANAILLVLLSIAFANNICIQLSNTYTNNDTYSYTVTNTIPIL